MADAVQALLLGAFGDQAFALPDELGGGAVDFFGDASAEGVVAVVDGLAASLLSSTSSGYYKRYMSSDS